jgi:hypothetical protein
VHDFGASCGTEFATFWGCGEIGRTNGRRVEMDTLDLFPELEGPAPKLIDGDDVVTVGSARSWATFSKDGVYRYVLGRQWNPDQAWLVVGMLNPSKADSDDDDPTIRRLVAFAKRDQCGGLLVWNAMAMITPYPKTLHECLLRGGDVVGPRNVEVMRRAVRAPLLARCVVAWGRPPYRRLEKLVRRAATETGCLRELWRFGPATKHGWPRHPLYLRADTQFQSLRPAATAAASSASAPPERRPQS